MPYPCVSPFEIEQIQLANRARRTKNAKNMFLRNLRKGIWNHLNGKSIEVHGNSKAPPFHASSNLGKIAQGMDKKLWESRRNSKKVAKWVRLNQS